MLDFKLVIVSCLLPRILDFRNINLLDYKFLSELWFDKSLYTSLLFWARSPKGALFGGTFPKRKIIKFLVRIQL